MFENKSTKQLFTKIYDVFFQEHHEYLCRYYNDKGNSSLRSKDMTAVPTYMLHYIKGEVVIADSEFNSVSDLSRKPANNNLFVSFKTKKKKHKKKIGVLFKSPYSRDLRVKWIAIEEEGLIKALHPYRDLHRDLSIIANRIGIKSKEIKFG